MSQALQEEALAVAFRSLAMQCYENADSLGTFWSKHCASMFGAPRNSTIKLKYPWCLSDLSIGNMPLP